MLNEKEWDGLAVFLKYKRGGPDEYGPLMQLRSFVERVFAGKRFRYVVVDNQLLGEETERQLWVGCDLIPGDNRWREFSGLEAGLVWAEGKGKLPPSMPVVLANDTFADNYGSDYLSLFQPEAVEAALKRGEMVGWVDAYPEPVELLGLRFQSWIRTSLVVATAAALSRSRPLFPNLPDASVFSEDWKTFFREDAPLSANYQEFLKTWLFADHAASSQFQERWHSQAKLDESSFNSMKGKAKSIFCEHLISARAAAAGIKIADVRNAQGSPA